MNVNTYTHCRKIPCEENYDNLIHTFEFHRDI